MLRKVCSMVFHCVLLAITLLFNSEAGAGTATFHFSGELVSALAEIHLNCDAGSFQTFRLLHTPHVGITISQQLYVHAYSIQCNQLLPRLHDYLGFPRRQRKARKLKRKKRHIELARSRYTGWKYNATLGFPGEGWWNPLRAIANWWNNPFTISTWNTRSLTKERFAYAKSLGHDVLAITELWRHQSEYLTK